MSGKGSFWDNPFGGLFDMNGDGKEDFGEQFLAYQIIKECTKEDDDNISPSFSGFSYFTPAKDYSWRQYVETDNLCGVYPEDYETEEEYLEAYHQAKYGWRDYCEDGLEYGVDPEDYETEEEYYDALEEARNRSGNANRGNTRLPISVEWPALDKLDAIKEDDFPNKRQYNASYTLANEFICYANEECEKREKACCEFILNNADSVLAANYCTHDHGFIYAQAVKDHFILPVSLPDEDEKPEYYITEIIAKISKKDVGLALQIWAWLVEQFLPYAHYTPYGEEELSFSIIDNLYSMPDSFTLALAHYLNDNPDFCDTIMSAHLEVSDSLPELIYLCIEEQLLELAAKLFKYGLMQANGSWQSINRLIEGTISSCKNYTDTEAIEFFRSTLFPLVRAINIGMVQDEIEEWEREITEYISELADF